jgi:ribosomal protein L11 methyltransferase
MKGNRTPPVWLEASVRVNEELAESVADVMARFAPNGVTLGYSSIEPDPNGEGRPRGPLTVRAYLPWGEDVQSRRTALEEALWHLGRISPIPEPVFREVVETDWSLEWKKHYRPFRIGKRLVIVPSWIDWNAAPGDVILRLDPGMAFGTGIPGKELIDLGCGSGILSIGGLRLGAGRAEGWDIDPEAVRVARENAVLNGVEARFAARPGTLEDMLKEKRTAPVVAANILAGVLQSMLHASLSETVDRGGCLILSGILIEQSAAVEAAIVESGLYLAEKKTREDWVALIAEK